MKKWNNYIYNNDNYKYFNGRILEYFDRIFIDLDQNIIRCRLYSLFPQNSIDGKPLFNGFGQKIYNDLIMTKKQKRKIQELMKLIS